MWQWLVVVFLVAMPVCDAARTFASTSSVKEAQLPEAYHNAPAVEEAHPEAEESELR